MKSSRPGEQFVVAVVFFGVGLAMLVAGLFWGWSNRRSLAGRHEATGRVIRVETTESDPDGGVQYFPTVEFTTAGGEYVQVTPANVRTESAFGGLVTVDRSDDGFDTRYDVGDEVGVYYNPANPADAVLDDFNRLWTGPLVVGGLGCCFFPLGLLLGVLAIARGRRR
jgi:hypothetical protein